MQRRQLTLVLVFHSVPVADPSRKVFRLSPSETVNLILHCGSKNVTPFTTAINPLILNELNWTNFAEIQPEEFSIRCYTVCTFTYYLIMQLGSSRRNQLVLPW